MALTAIDERKKIYSPHVLIREGLDQSEVAILMEQIQPKYCADCFRFANELLEVGYVDATDRRPHFRHKGKDGGEKCANYSAESDRHRNAKALIARHYELDGTVTGVTVDEEFVGQENFKRKPDVLVQYANGSLHSHEVQISKINVVELNQRTQDQRKAGISVIHWYFTKRNYSNRNLKLYCYNNNIPFYLLWFEESDDARPRYKEGSVDLDGKPKVQPDSVAKCHHLKTETLNENRWQPHPVSQSDRGATIRTNLPDPRYRKRLPWLDVHDAYARIKQNLSKIDNQEAFLTDYARKFGIESDRTFLQLAYLPDRAVMELDKDLKKLIESDTV